MPVVILMGVSGCGKTSIGKQLESRYGWSFSDGDDFHSEQNKLKMASGIPLSDQDRIPWLEGISRFIASCSESTPSVVACSALKPEYREILVGNRSSNNILFAHLKLSEQTAMERLKKRKEHFFNPQLVSNQFEVLKPISEEEALNWITIDVENVDIDSIVTMKTLLDRTKTVPRWQLFAAIGGGAALCFIIGISVYFGSHCNRSPPPCPNGGKSTSTVAPASQPTKSPPINYKSYFLPKNLVPYFYKLDLKTNLPSSAVSIAPVDMFKFLGNISIHLTCLTPTNKIVLSWNQLNMTSLLLTDPSGNQIAVTSHSYAAPQQMMTFNLASTLKANTNYTFLIHFWAYLNDNLVGYYRSYYMEGGVKRWMSVTQMEPTDARTAFPCFDEPDFKAIFEISMTYPNTYKTLSNAENISDVDIGGGWTKTQFDKGLRMSSYLVAYTVMDFEHTHHYTSDNKTLFRIWARRELVNQTQFATLLGPQCLDFYGSYFNVPFPLKKQDMLAVPDFDAGAMENWGLVTYRESRLTYVDGKYPASAKWAVSNTICHELAHQWFGDLVTMRWWNDLFLNEGFADYLENVGMDGVPILNGSFDTADYSVSTDTDPAFGADQILNSHPISFNVNPTVTSINQLFDTITYQKGGSVLKMLNFTLTQPVFVSGLTNYLRKYAKGNPTHNDLWNELTAVVQKNGNILDWNNQKLNVSQFMNPWVTQAGFPIINLTWNPTHNAITLTQQRFLISPPNKTTSKKVALENRNPIRKRMQFLVTLSGLSPQQWLLVNYQVHGFYRVNYDPNNWKLLTAQLMSAPLVIPLRNRVQLLDDAWAIAKAGYIDYSIPLRMSLYLRQEFNYLPWRSQDNTLTFMNKMFGLGQSYQPFRNYLASIIKPVYQHYGWTDNESDNLMNLHNTRRYAIWLSCDLDVQDCVNNARVQFKQMQQACNGSTKGTYYCSTVSPNYRHAVYCSGIRHGSVGDWMRLWAKYPQEQVSNEKNNILYGLACTREPWLLIRLLSEALSATTIRSQDARYAFEYVGDNPIGPAIAWTYISENWASIRQKYARTFGFSISRIVNAATSSFNTQFQINQLQNFMSSNDLGSASYNFKSALERAISNQQWMTKYANYVIQWIKNQNFPSA